MAGAAQPASTLVVTACPISTGVPVRAFTFMSCFAILLLGIIAFLGWKLLRRKRLRRSSGDLASLLAREQRYRGGDAPRDSMLEVDDTPLRVDLAPPSRAATRDVSPRDVVEGESRHLRQGSEASLSWPSQERRGFI